MSDNEEKKEPTLDDILNQTAQITNSLMKDIYQDFYGAGGAFAPGKSSGYSAPVKPADDNAASKENSQNPTSVQNEKVQDTAANTEQTNQTAVQTAAAVDAEPEKSGKEQLEELTGLKNIKHDVAELTSLMKVQKMREEKGLNFVPTSLHLVFAGNPGTGKTTVARILAKLYKEIGVLSKGQLVEVDRSGLVAGYVGQTAIKTQEKIQEAMGGILFIDEAYTLAKDDDAFGQEAIDTILKAMEDNRKDFIVIAAGYTKPMMKFIESNPGLKSRFNKYLYFEDYTADELITIFDMQCKKYSYHLTEEARKEAEQIIREIEENKDENFANAREVRNFFEEIITNQARRIAEIEDLTEEQLTEITVEDLHDNEEDAI